MKSVISSKPTSDSKVFIGVVVAIVILIVLAFSSFSRDSPEQIVSKSKQYALARDYAVHHEPHEDPLAIFTSSEQEQNSNDDVVLVHNSKNSPSSRASKKHSTGGRNQQQFQQQLVTPVPPPKYYFAPHAPFNSGNSPQTMLHDITYDPNVDDSGNIPLIASEYEEMYAFTPWLDDKKEWAPTSVEYRCKNKPLALALREFNHVDWHDIKNGNLEVICILSIMATDNCHPWKDTLVNCVLKHGKRNFDKILNNRCVSSSFWMTTLPSLLDDRTANDGVDEGPDGYKKLNRGVIWDSQIKKSSDNWKEKSWPYIPPEKRTVAPFPAGRNCSATCQHLPIGFGLPKQLFKKRVPRTKNFDWMPLQPKYTPAVGPYEVRITDEDLFTELYSQSFFAWTHRRAGWEAMRHYDIIAAGGCPFFFDIEYAPTRTLGHFPKDLLKEVLEMPGVEHIRKNPARYVVPNMFGGVNFRVHGDIRRTGDPLDPMFNVTYYFELTQKILDWGRKYMTCEAVVSYVLKALKAEDAKTMIIFSRGTNDYTELTLSCAQNLGIDITFITDAEHNFYKMRFTDDGKMTREERDEWLAPHHATAYGAAFGFASRFGPRITFRRNQDARVIQAIKEQQFDVAIWSLSGTNYNYVPKFKDWSPKTKLGFVNFHDQHGDPDQNTRNGCDLLGNREGIVFVREMSDTNRC